MFDGENQSLIQHLEENTAYDEPEATRVILGELGTGKKWDDPDAYIGANTFLRVNGYDPEHVLIAGGLNPEMPETYGVVNAQRMRALGYDPEKEVDDSEGRIQAWSALVGNEENAEYLQEHKEKWIDKKINSWGDLKRYNQRMLEFLFDGLDPEAVDYCMGEEDSRFNKREIEKKQLTKLKRKLNEYKEELEEEYNSVEERLEAVIDQFDEDQEAYQALIELHNRVSSHYQHAEDVDIPGFVDRILDGENSEFWESLDEEFREELRQVDTVNEYEALYEEEKAELQEVAALKENLIIEKEDLEEELANLDLEDERGSFARFTKQYAIEKKDAEELYLLVKNELTEKTKNHFPDRIQDKLSTHISRYAEIEDVDADIDEDDIGVEVFGDTMVIHSTKDRSDTTTLFGIDEAEMEVIYRNAIQDTLQDEDRVPDTVIVPHGAGGFVTKRVNITPEHRRVDGEHRDDPNMVSVMTLPVFQSTDKLIDFKEKGFRMWDVKRIDKHLHSSGMVLQNMMEDGSEVHEFIHHTSLAKLGQMTRELWELEEGTDEYQELEQEIQETAQIQPYAALPFADVHIGAANQEGTPTNYQRAQRFINFLDQVYDGYGDELILSETAEGYLDHTNMEKHVFGEAPNLMRNQIVDMAGDVLDEDYENPEELAIDMFKYTMELSNRLTVNMERMPIPHRNKQMNAVEDFLGQIIDAVEPVVYSLVAGNHNRDSAGGDEAYDLKDKVEKVDQDAYHGEKTIHVFDAAGDKHGGYGTIVREPSGTRVTYQHKMKGGKHEHRRKADQVLSANWGSDEVHVDHNHTPFGWFTTGTAGTEAAAFKAPDPYSTVNGFGTAPYGGIIKFSNEAPEDHPASDMIYHAWHHILDDTLENGEFDGDELDDFHTQLAENMAEEYSDILGMDVEDLQDELTGVVHRTNADNA